MDGRAMGCMGHAAMRRVTPNIDAIAERGTLFRYAYTNNPICCPSRASMWSGLYTYQCEGWNNYKGLEPGTETFRSRLESAGYHFGSFGKEDYLSGHHTARARVSAWTRSANIMRPNYCEAAPVVIPGDVERVHEIDWKCVDSSIKWLQEHGRSEKPFALYVGLHMPHPKFRSSERYTSRVPAASCDPAIPDEDWHPVMNYQRVNKNWTHGFSPEMVRKVRSCYFAMIAEVDDLVGRLLAALKDQGLTESTTVVFTSDHGEMNMEHRQFYKMNHYEPSARVPMIIAGPGLRRGATTDTLVSLVDIYPTLMDIAGLEGPRGLPGHSLLPLASGGADTHPGWVLSEFHDSTLPTGSFMLRRDRWKYIAYPGYRPMLFDLEDDPDELINLESANKDIAKELDGVLRGIVDYESIDAKVKEYDRASFVQWRRERQEAGDYSPQMARIFSGWDPGNITPWQQADEDNIENWLRGNPAPLPSA